MLMTLNEASRFLKVSRSSLYQWCAIGIVPYIRVGRQIRLDDAAILEHFKSGAFELAKSEKIRGVK